MTSPSRLPPSPGRRWRPSGPRSRKPRGCPRSPSAKKRGSPRCADRTSEHQSDRQYPLGIAGAAQRVRFHAAVFPAGLRHLSARPRLRVGHQRFRCGLVSHLILSGHAKDDGTDLRGLVISGYLICCLAAPIAYGLGRLVGLDAPAALAAVALSLTIGLFELTRIWFARA